MMKNGWSTAFAQVVERHRRELRVHCYRMVGSVDDAEDLVQETFLRAWRHIAGFEGRSTLRAWLYRIATNAALDELRVAAAAALPTQVAARTKRDLFKRLRMTLFGRRPRAPDAGP